MRWSRRQPIVCAPDSCSDRRDRETRFALAGRSALRWSVLTPELRPDGGNENFVFAAVNADAARELFVADIDALPEDP